MPHSTPLPQSAWRTALQRRLLGRKPSAQHALGHRNIYVLPSAAGWMLAVTLLVLLVASINFQLNLGYALTFLIAGSACASLWMGHRNLRGLQLRLGTIQPVFQGDRASVPLLLQHRHAQRATQGVSIALYRSKGALAWVHADVLASQTHTVTLGSVPHQRGWHRVPLVVIESRFPLGVFRLWSYWQPDSMVLVYPAPETPCPPVSFTNDQGQGPQQPQSHGATEPDGVRSYQRGDALRSMVWKKAATALATGSGDLVVRDRSTLQIQNLWLDARATALADPEAQIARLTAWVLHAHAQQWIWGLKLPSGLRIDPASGTQHLHDCLTALATDGHPSHELSIKKGSNP